MSPIFTGSKFGFGRVDAATTGDDGSDPDNLFQQIQHHMIWGSNGTTGDAWSAPSANVRARIDSAGNVYNNNSQIQGYGYLKCTFTPNKATSLILIRCFLPYYGETVNHSDHATFFLYKYTGADSNISMPALNCWKYSARYSDNHGNNSIVANVSGNHVEFMHTFQTLDTSKEAGARTYQLRGGYNNGAMGVCNGGSSNPVGSYLKPTQGNMIITEIADAEDNANAGS